MRVLLLGVIAASLLLCAVAQTPAEVGANKPCELPADLAKEVARKYPATHLLSFEDLSEEDLQLFKADHGDQCPGLVKVNFYGDGKPTLALVLSRGSAPSRKAMLVVATQLGGRWHTRLLERTEGTPVLWRDAPGRYTDVYGKRAVKALRPVIVFAGLESWAVVYVWTGTRVEKVQLAD